MTHAKICGITNLEDARCAVAFGAHLIGFVFAPSPRHVEPQTAATICRDIPAGVERVGVFVNEEPARILEVARVVALTMVQLHGEESEGTVAQVGAETGLPVIRAIRVTGLDEALDRARETKAPYLLVEPRVPGLAGGTGTSLDPDLAARIFAAFAAQSRKAFLAGGLGADNVRALVRRVNPYGVDASSRLEISPGKKDHGLVKQFLEAVRT